ncbi:hypothetical protein ACN20G_33330 (plasmid) [Streptomyces sp. BI20]|uniref:hypothetical protein n=1 Tax=Streptomyces sp. BI20 TaxID=3403460 RepID=UPI003C7779F7
MAKPLIMGRQEIARVYGIGVQAITTQWVPRGVLGYDSAAIVSGKAVWPGGLIVSLAKEPGKRGRQLNPEALAALKVEQGAGYAPMKAEEMPRLVGSHEVAAIFGVPQIYVNQGMNAAQKMLPEPDWTISGSPVWILETITAGVEHTEAVSAAARTSPGRWRADASVIEALTVGAYDGPGSTIAARGVHAKAADSA